MEKHCSRSERGHRQCPHRHQPRFGWPPMRPASGRSAAAEAEKPAEAAATPAAEEKSDAAPPAAATKSGDKAKYLFVEIAISNKGGRSNQVQGWNNPGMTGAILADDQNQIFPLVPKSETPGVQRLGAADVPGRVDCRDLGVEAPSGSSTLSTSYSTSRLLSLDERQAIRSGNHAGRARQ